jgi:hypothetical protein
MNTTLDLSIRALIILACLVGIAVVSYLTPHSGGFPSDSPIVNAAQNVIITPFAVIGGALFVNACFWVRSLIARAVSGSSVSDMSDCRPPSAD